MDGSSPWLIKYNGLAFHHYKDIASYWYLPLNPSPPQKRHAQNSGYINDGNAVGTVQYTHLLCHGGRLDWAGWAI